MKIGLYGGLEREQCSRRTQYATST